MPIKSPSAISFDCYGTLVDWESGISTFLTQTFKEKGVIVDVGEVLRAREDIEFELIQGAYRSYREILSLSLKEAFYRFSVPYSGSDGERLAESVPSWPVFTETRPALERLGERSRLAIISNIDNDIIEKTRSNIGAGFQLVVTAQDARAYKPSTKPFELARRKLDCKPSEVLHVSSGFRYDIPPARKLGFRTAWINRKHEKKPSRQRADYEFDGLTQLAEALGEQTRSQHAIKR
jgi:2-haloalkanoic acid dehalogenase type II